jgi:nitrate/nitrite transporter NarK
VTGRRGRFFYGWWIVGAGFGIEVLIGALLFHAYGAYVVLLREEFGWSRTMLSAAFAMARAESAILGPVQGWLADRFGPRTFIRIGMVVFAAGFMLFSQVGSPLTFPTPPPPPAREPVTAMTAPPSRGPVAADQAPAR